jgi:Spx/MgsR family transcriptional regulator
MTAAPRAVLHGIPNCDTVKKARAWLAAQGLEHDFHDFKKQGVPAALDEWIARVGWERLLNRQGTTWRKLDAATQAAAADATGAAALMRAQPSVIKRPVVHWPDGGLTVGFDPAEFARRAGG